MLTEWEYRVIFIPGYTAGFKEKKGCQLREADNPFQVIFNSYY